MFVKDHEDMTKVLKRQKESSGLHSDSWEKEYELQHAWDKQAIFLQAQSRAMDTLQSMITKYEDLLLKDLATEEQKMRLEKLKVEIKHIEKGSDKGSIADAMKSAIDQIKERRKERVADE